MDNTPRKTFILIFVLWLMSSSPLVSAAVRGRYVYDYVGLLNDSEKGAIESLCLDIDQNTTAEIVIVIIADLSEHNGDINSAKVKILIKFPLAV